VGAQAAEEQKGGEALDDALRVQGFSLASLPACAPSPL